jgi:hypothetical protein|tara:strand:+ start:133 stop:333 length:201 start_codon:yes stop_codon:yes gene_type:complete
MKTKKQLAIQVCEYLHERALKEDEEHKKKARAEKRSADAEGESGMVFHTRNLLELLKELKPDDCNS